VILHHLRAFASFGIKAKIKVSNIFPDRLRNVESHSRRLNLKVCDCFRSKVSDTKKTNLHFYSRDV